VDPTSTPWRALEDLPDRMDGSAEAAPPPPTVPRSALLAGGGAVLLAIAAFFVAFGSSSGGTVSVDGGTALTTDASDSGNPSGSITDSLGAVGGDRVLVVEIVGAIENPGVFRLPAGSRIGDLVQAAGGYGPRVDTDRAGRDLNLAAQLHDGDQIRVPSRDDQTATAAQPGSGTGSSGDAGAPVDLNHATAAELDALPGIGPVTAAKIIASRDEQPFAAVQDLRTRKLVGEKTFANLKDLVAVR
jgi:DNA uptake protein and related DNA-binding proteins